MIKPIGKRILVEPIKLQERVDGGIVLPANTALDQQEGTVIAVGSLVTDVKPGDRVILAKFDGTELDHEGQKLILADERAVLAVLA